MRLLRGALLLWLMSWLVAAFAEMPVIAVSTNDSSPLGRKVLEHLSKEACRRIGVEFRLVRLPTERSMMLANAGEVDGEGLRVAGLTAQYANLLQVPEPYMRVGVVAFAKDATITLDKGWASLKPYSVAFINGWHMVDANVAGARAVTRVNQPEQLFRMLDGGRVDLVIYTRQDGIVLARELGLPSIVPLSPAFKEVDTFLYLHKKHRALVPRLAQALRDMKADGTYNRILSGIYVE